MRFINNIIIYIAAIAVCVIAAVLAAMFNLIANAIAFVITPVWLAVYAAAFAWSGDEAMSARWETPMRRVQVIFALPAATVAAMVSIVNDSLRIKLR